MDVAEPWLDKLLQEFFKQSDAEKLEGLPVTPFMDREKITKPSSQCSFIGFVLLPLFEALGELFIELQVIFDICLYFRISFSFHFHFNFSKKINISLYFAFGPWQDILCESFLSCLFYVNRPLFVRVCLHASVKIGTWYPSCRQCLYIHFGSNYIVYIQLHRHTK